MDLARRLNRALGIGVIALGTGFIAACGAQETASSSAPVDAATLTTTLANAETRSVEDKARDAGRKPGEVLAFAGLTPGMRVLDMWAAGGWYTEVLSIAVGPDGEVVSQNPPPLLQFRGGANGLALSARLAENRLPNVTRLDSTLAAADLEAGSFDFALTALNYHDVFIFQGADGAAALTARLLELIRPGGTLLIVDHNANPGADYSALHRMPKADAIATATAAGFVLAGESDVLANPDDDRTVNVFQPEIRGQTDRFVLKFTKPEA